MDQKSAERVALEPEHLPDVIRERLMEKKQASVLGDAVLGAIDGGVTCFAIVSAAVGGGLSSRAIVILGFANLLADGFSMAVSNFQAKRSEAQLIEKVRRGEAQHIEHYPEGEREEVRQIYQLKGFEGELLEHIVEVVTKDRERWIDTMLTEEFGLPLQSSNPVKAGSATFVAFLLAGLVPLLPYLIAVLEPTESFQLSALLTALLFLGIGAWKGHVVGSSRLRSGLATLALGGGAATLAYLVGYLLEQGYR